jgi:hypothetical protein
VPVGLICEDQDLKRSLADTRVVGLANAVLVCGSVASDMFGPAADDLGHVALVQASLH